MRAQAKRVTLAVQSLVVRPDPACDVARPGVVEDLSTVPPARDALIGGRNRRALSDDLVTLEAIDRERDRQPLYARTNSDPLLDGFSAG
jgi:hypothetical protein